MFYIYYHHTLVIVTSYLYQKGSVKEMLNLSQQDYINRIEELNNALIIAWEQDQRVKALKIAIQVSFQLIEPIYHDVV